LRRRRIEYLLPSRCYVTPLLGAYIADEKWGRFNTIAVAVAIALVGHVILVISAIPPVIVHPNAALAALCVAIIVMGLGTGGFKANISPLVAEQQRLLRPFVSETKSGERVIVDPTLTTSRIYMVCIILHTFGQFGRSHFFSISISLSMLVQWSVRSP
jgi:POT family proton-dependent oligopeptide transporter